MTPAIQHRVARLEKKAGHGLRETIMFIEDGDGRVTLLGDCDRVLTEQEIADLSSGKDVIRIRPVRPNGITKTEAQET